MPRVSANKPTRTACSSKRRPRAFSRSMASTASRSPTSWRRRASRMVASTDISNRRTNSPRSRARRRLKSRRRAGGRSGRTARTNRRSSTPWRSTISARSSGINPASDVLPIRSRPTSAARMRRSPFGSVYTRGLKTLIDILMSFSTARQTKKARRRALARMSMLIGAVTLARAVRDDPLSDEILEAAREHLRLDSE